MLVITCSSRLRSHRPVTAPGASMVSSQPARTASSWKRAPTSYASWVRSTSSISSSSRPDEIRDTSSSSLIRRCSRSAWPPILPQLLTQPRRRHDALVSLGEALQVGDLELQRRQRRAQLVRRHGKEVVALDDRALQLLCGALVIVDVDRGHDPADHRPLLVALGHHAAEVPAIRLVGGTPQAQLPLKGPVPVADGRLPVGLDQRALVGVDHLPEGIARDLVGDDPAVGEAGAVPVVDLPLGVGRPDALGHRIEQAAVAVLAAALGHLALALAQHPLLQLDRLALEIQVDEDRDLRAEDLRLERLEQIVDRAL